AAAGGAGGEPGMPPPLLVVVASAADAVALGPVMDMLRKSAVHAPAADAAWRLFVFSPALGCHDLAKLWGLSELTCSPRKMRIFAPWASDPVAAGTVLGRGGVPYTVTGAIVDKIEAGPDPDGWTYLRGVALHSLPEWESRVETNLRHVLKTVQ
ncbi:unnamed protein product, partial [Phaeothamnion confervicola]